MSGYAFNRYDIVELLADRPGLPAGSYGQVLGFYSRPSETSYVVAFEDRVVEDLHADELAFVRSEPDRVGRSQTRQTSARAVRPSPRLFG